MKESRDFKQQTAFGLLLQGPPKTGKTRTSLLFPRPYIADCDNNLGGAVRSLRETHPNSAFRYDTIGVADDGTVVPAGKRWPRLLTCLNTALADPWVGTIVIDSISSVADMLIEFIVAAKKGTGKEEDRMTISDWVPFRNLLTKLVVDLRHTRRYLVVTSHEELVKDEVTGAVTVRTNIPSKLADNFGAFFSDVWRCDIQMSAEGKPIYYVRATPTNRYPAVGNSLGLPDQFIFSWEALQKHFAKSLGNDSSVTGEPTTN